MDKLIYSIENDDTDTDFDQGLIFDENFSNLPEEIKQKHKEKVSRLASKVSNGLIVSELGDEE